MQSATSKTVAEPRIRDAANRLLAKVERRNFTSWQRVWCVTQANTIASVALVSECVKWVFPGDAVPASS
jgi:hypothetical protein